jgi:CRISPR-associated protein Cas6/Cse3/CasE subtype I-E
MKISNWKILERDFVENEMYDNYKAHQIISNIFNESVQFDVSYKNMMVEILIYSNNEIKNIPTFGQIISKDFNPSFQKTNYKIKVNANIVKSVKQDDKCKKIPLTSEIDVLEYFNERSEKFGITINSLISSGSKTKTFFKNSSKITATSSDLTISCNVFNEELFKNMVFTGIGSQRKFGYGLVKVFKTP